MIFPKLELEKTIQINDKTRLNATKSFISKGEAAITLIEIEPEAAAGFVDVTNADSDNYYLDWAYAGATRQVIASVRITTDGAPVTTTETLEVITATDDALFSGDNDIIQYEKDIMNHIRPGRSSYLDKHREAQVRILSALDEKGIKDEDGDRLTKTDILDPTEILDWSKFIALAIIFGEISNAKDDIFNDKSNKYKKMANETKTRAFLRLDLNNDGILDDNEFTSMTQGFIGRA